MSSATGPAAGDNKTSPAQPPPVSSANPYQTSIDQIRSTATWLIGAFAAVATVMLAGSQLSSVGKLTMADDPIRLCTALSAAVVVVGATIFAIYSLSNVLTPVVSSLKELREEAAGSRTGLASFVANDSGFLAGKPDVSTLLTDYQLRRVDQVNAHRDQVVAEVELDQAEDDTGRTAASAKLNRADRRRLRADTEVGILRRAVVSLTQLRGYLTVSKRFEEERTKVVWSGVAAALAIVAFAWAANPPQIPAAEPPIAVLQPRPVMARLVLTPAGVTELSGVLGAECASAAGADGVPTVVLGATASAVEIVIPAGGSCSQTARLQLEPRLGHAVAASQAPLAPVPTNTP
jgi:hypothetical protein